MLPKPPVTAYFQFVNVKRKCLKEKHPELSGAELTTKLSKKWKSLPKEKQDKYRSLYQRMREDYLTELEEFYTQHPEAQPLKVSRYKTPCTCAYCIHVAHFSVRSYLEET